MNLYGNNKINNKYTSTVGVQKTSPKSVLADYTNLMHLVNYQKYLPKNKKTIIKLNLTWSLYFPGCSTEPWQLEGILKTLREDGYDNIVAMENKTVVTNPVKGALQNKWLPILKKYEVDFIPLTNVKWVEYKPKKKLLVLDKIFENLEIPEDFIGANVIHLPTIKTHGHSVMTGAMKNAFGGLLKEARHHCHKYIHEVLTDLLIIQKEIHTGLFAVTDGTICGDGAGPRTMHPIIKNYILSSGDMVAIDTVVSKMMGFDPISIKKIKLSDEMGLGCGNIDKIKILGEDISDINFGFKTIESPIIFFDKFFRSSLIEPLMFKTWFFNFCIISSALYHDYFWYPLIGKKRVNDFMKTEWGRLFEKY